MKLINLRLELLNDLSEVDGDPFVNNMAVARGENHHGKINKKEWVKYENNEMQKSCETET